MKRNLGSADRIIRVLIGVAAAVLYFTGTLSGALGLTLLIAGGILALTSFVSFCPIYAALGINSCPVGESR